MEGIKAKPDRGDRERRNPPGEANRQREIGDAEENATEDRQAGLSEQVHELLNRGGIKQATYPERTHDQADGGEAQTEPQMQIGAHVSEGTPCRAGLEEHSKNDQPCPWVRQHGDIVADEAARAFIGSAGRAGARVGQKLEHQPRGRQGEHRSKQEKHIAPAEQVAEHAARRLAEELAENLSGQVAGENRLPALVRRYVADIGHGEWNDPASGCARRKTRNRERGERLHRTA